jgi:poly(A) polymerase
LLSSDDATEILGRLNAFFAARQITAYLVGGYLRDSLLSIPSHDIDIALLGDAHPVGQALARHLGGAYVPLSRSFNVARIVIPRRARDNEGIAWNVDLAGYSGAIEDDLARRDFTVDALALPLDCSTSDRWREQILDPTGGLADLAGKCIRAVSPGVFRDDAGRLIRAVRLAARLGFRLEPATAQLVRAAAPLVERVSPERVRDEFLGILAADGARGQLEVLDRLDLLCRIIPELALTKGVEQPRVHYWDVWGHLIHSVEAAELVAKGHQNSAIYSHVPWTAESVQYFNQEISDGHTRRTMLRLAALLHDIAKPQTKTQDATGRTRFFGHSELGAEMAAHRLAQLRLSSRGISLVTRMVEQHLRPAGMAPERELPSQRAIYRYHRDLGDAAVDTVYLAMADYLAAKGPEVVPDDWARHARIMTYILEMGGELGTRPAQSQPQQRLVTGNDLMQAFGLEPGPHIGVLLDQIGEAHAAGEIDSREEALALAEQALNNPPQ